MSSASSFAGAWRVFGDAVLAGGGSTTQAPMNQLWRSGRVASASHAAVVPSTSGDKVSRTRA